MLIQEHEIGRLLSEWEGRLRSDRYSEEYRCALGECLYDLRELMGNSLDYQESIQEAIAKLPSREVEDYLMGLEADEELSMMESHETVA